MKKTVFGIFLTGITTITMAQQIKYPQTMKQDHTDEYFGTQISDPYRWLENDTAANTCLLYTSPSPRD